MNRAWRLASSILKKSPRLTLKNVTDRLFFDFINGIDTVKQVQKENFSSNLPNLDHGIHYASSWTSEIKYGYVESRKFLGPAFTQFEFVDIGCGKGKGVIVWLQMLRRDKLTQIVHGVEYSKPLSQIAEYNILRATREHVKIYNVDASLLDYNKISDSLIVYLFHPFDGVILSEVLLKFVGMNIVLIYNNPVHEDVLQKSGYSKVAEKIGFHPQAQVVIYSNWRPSAS